MSTSKKLAVAAVLIVVGIVLMVMPTPGEPSLVCVKQGQPSSGFSDGDQGDCPVSIESYNDYREWASGPRWDNIAGLVLVLGGLGYAGLALVRGRRRREQEPVAA